MQGGIEDGEEPKSAALRELQEETGIVSADIIAEVPHWVTYDFPPAVKAKVNRLWGGEWHGQAQKWFLMRLTRDDSEVNLASGEVEPEFSEWKWTSPEEVIEQVCCNKFLLISLNSVYFLLKKKKLTRAWEIMNSGSGLQAANIRGSYENLYALLQWKRNI
ncbi:hypothetical protein HHK36_006797 [Tetracentron sinense]|uniref:Nudix hydrolase domain-containing protein n=1 Tax=Tetracentron sinense TaxID=13715 RepID=A0A834ZSD3_TETSI|nr:hypothetical protein HHK36_006797 [Tetracentron sinense]